MIDTGAAPNLIKRNKLNHTYQYLRPLTFDRDHGWPRNDLRVNGGQHCRAEDEISCSSQ